MPSIISPTMRSNASLVTCAEGLAPQAMVGISSQPRVSASSIKPARLHHGDVVADLRGDAQIVGDEQHRQTEAGLEVFEQLQHLRLHRDVERGDGFVGDDALPDPSQARGRCR
jgi:hypothetical protein